MLLLTGKLSLLLLPAKTDPKSPPLTISSFVYSASKWATHPKIHVLHTWTLDNVKGFSFCQLYHKAGVFNSDEPGSFLWYHKYTRLNYPNEETKDLLKEMYCMALGSLKMNDDQTVLGFFPNATLGHRNCKNWPQTEILYVQSTSKNRFLTYPINLLLSSLLSHVKNKSTFLSFFLKIFLYINPVHM